MSIMSYFTPAVRVLSPVTCIHHAPAKYSLLLAAILAVSGMGTSPCFAAETGDKPIQPMTKTPDKVNEATSKKAKPIIGKVSINSASAEELQTLKGVGVTKANAIVDYRTQNGKFKSIDDLVNVTGIGPKLVESNRDILTL